MKVSKVERMIMVCVGALLTMMAGLLLWMLVFGETPESPRVLAALVLSGCLLGWVFAPWFWKTER